MIASLDHTFLVVSTRYLCVPFSDYGIQLSYYNILQLDFVLDSIDRLQDGKVGRALSVALQDKRLRVETSVISQCMRSSVLQYVRKHASPASSVTLWRNY